MQVLQKLDYIQNLALALGFFDGVHIAHQKLIKKTVAFAHENKSKSAVITLKQQPYCYLNNIEPKFISERAESYKIIENLGVDYLIELDFNDVMQLTPLEYLRDILIKYFEPTGIFTGFNHHFGLGRKGNCEFLRQYQNVFGYKFYQLESQKLNGQLISSSAIRKFLETGQIEWANSMLGREFFVEGTVTEGNKIGRTINFPTANTIYPKNIIEIPNGVYETEVELPDGTKIKSIANFGKKPTVNDTNNKTLETHILNNFNKNIYGQNIKIYFSRFIRPERKFDNIEELKKQINNDISRIKCQ